MKLNLTVLVFLIPNLLSPIYTFISEQCPNQVVLRDRQSIESHERFGKEDYPNEFICVYEILAPDDHQILLKFEIFDVEDSLECVYDRVSIHGIKSNYREIQCGQEKLDAIFIPDNHVKITFESDLSKEYKGFRITVLFLTEKEFMSTPTFAKREENNSRMKENGCGQAEKRREKRALHSNYHHRVSKRIVGGNDVTQGKWPWMVSLSLLGKHSCGASILNKKWLLTAAHCFRRMRKPTFWRATIGEFNIFEASDYEKKVRFSQIIVHQDFGKQNRHDKDVALIELKNEIDFTENISPICLPSEDVDDDVDTEQYRDKRGPFGSGECYVSGWGHTKGHGKHYIQKDVQLPLMDTSVCNSSIGMKGLITSSMLCAGFLAGRKDACQGDSGGPLFCRDYFHQRWYQMGIVSFGEGCAKANHPGVYTNVKKMKYWIQETLRANGFQI